MYAEGAIMPLELSRCIFKRYPYINDAFPELRSRYKDCWPDQCYLSLSKSIPFLAKQYYLSSNSAEQEGSLATACYIWNNTKKIYSFDVALAESLAAQVEDMSDSDPIPALMLSRLPYPCIYIHAPDTLAKDIDGFFLWLDHKMESKEDALRFHYIYKNGTYTIPYELVIREELTLADIYPAPMLIAQDAAAGAYHGNETALGLLSGELTNGASVGTFVRDLVLRSIQLVLYLTSATPEIAPAPRKQRTSNEAETQKKASTAPDDSAVETYSVGVRVGKALRTVYSHASGGGNAGTGKPRRAHTRRGHWHRYWTGSKKEPEKRKLEVRWVPPVMVSGSDARDLATVTPVK